MEKHLPLKFRKGLHSVTQSRPTVIQGQSQLAPNPQSPKFPSLPSPPQPPMAHQNRDNLAVIPAHGVPFIAPVPPPHFVPQPQPPPKYLSSELVSIERCRCPRCMQMKCILNSPTMTFTMEQVQTYKDKMDDCYKRLLEKELKVKDLTSLAEGQGVEMGIIHGKLELQLVENKELEGTVNKLLGEIVKLNDVVAEKNKALLEYKKTVEEYKECFEGLKEYNKKLEEKLEETKEFMRNVNAEFKEGVGNLTSEYCKSSDGELGQHQKEIEGMAANETGEVEFIEEIEKEKGKFCETASVLVEMTDMGLEEYTKQIGGQIEEVENEEGEVVPQVSKIHLRKINEIWESPLPSNSLTNGDGEWSIVLVTEEVEQEIELWDEDKCEENLGSEILPPVLDKNNEEINETSGDRYEPSLNKIKRKRATEDLESEYEDDDQERSDHGYLNGGNKKARKDFEGESIAVGLFEKNELTVNEDLGNCITLHYDERNEDVENVAIEMEVGMKEQEALLDDMSCSSNSLAADVKVERFVDYGAISEIFCTKCFTPFPTEEGLKTHLSQKSCSDEKSDTESDHSEEECIVFNGELLDV